MDNFSQEYSNKLKTYLQRREDLLGMLSNEKKRLEHPRYALVKEDIESLILILENKINKIDAYLAQAITDTPELVEKADLLKSIPGVGQVVSTIIIIGLPELGHLEGKKISALVGVAPITKQSGQQQGGRLQVKQALYVATLSGISCNVKLKAFYQGLLARGKQPKVALTATMRKLLTIMNIMMKNGRPWNPDV